MGTIHIPYKTKRSRAKYPHVTIVKNFGVLKQKNKNNEEIKYELKGYAEKTIKNSTTSGLQESLDLIDSCGAEYTSLSPPNNKILINIDTPIHLENIVINREPNEYIIKKIKKGDKK